METGILQALKQLGKGKIPIKYKLIGIIIPFIGLLLEIGIGFDINPNIVPGSLSIYGEKFYADPLIPSLCIVGKDGGCPQFFQSRFRFQWIEGASNVLIHGISKKLSVNWGDIAGDGIGGEDVSEEDVPEEDVVGGRITMVATTDNDTNVNYQLVQNKKENIPAFCITTICNNIVNFPGSTSFRNLSINTTSLLKVVQEDPGLEGRWMAEVIKLEQDNINETTRISFNLVKILDLGSSCEENTEKSEKSEKFQLCRPQSGKNITCSMNTHVEYANYITAGCDTCMSGGITNLVRKGYSSPKPVFGDYMYGALTSSYGGHLPIPYCSSSDDSVGGCLTHNTNSVDEVRNVFVELLRGIIVSGVMVRRNLLFGMGKELLVESLIKGTIGIRLEFGKGYWITILIISIICFVGFIFWFWLCFKSKFVINDRISIKWLFRPNILDKLNIRLNN